MDLYQLSLSFQEKKNCLTAIFNPIQDETFRCCSRMKERGQKRLPPKICYRFYNNETRHRYTF